ncbi:hypothetical protein DIPPA_21507 [Diplonema papillatum]|nr:hypothetical protein DIPPA_21507 [Diplonema papillatum]
MDRHKAGPSDVQQRPTATTRRQPPNVDAQSATLVESVGSGPKEDAAGGGCKSRALRHCQTRTDANANAYGNGDGSPPVAEFSGVDALCKAARQSRRVARHVFLGLYYLETAACCSSAASAFYHSTRTASPALGSDRSLAHRRRNQEPAAPGVGVHSRKVAGTCGNSRVVVQRRPPCRSSAPGPRRKQAAFLPRCETDDLIMVHGVAPELDAETKPCTSCTPETSLPSSGRPCACCASAPRVVGAEPGLQASDPFGGQVRRSPGDVMLATFTQLGELARRVPSFASRCRGGAPAGRWKPQGTGSSASAAPSVPPGWAIYAGKSERKKHPSPACRPRKAPDAWRDTTCTATT